MPEVPHDSRFQPEMASLSIQDNDQCLVQPSDPPLEDLEVQQGRIFWLPSKEEVSRRASREKLSNEGLWRREVRRGHSSGAIDEGIYSHPVVVVSRPREDSRCVHFLLITSFNGKRLDQVYAKPKEFHAGRRTWYLPVAPTADHPDALSKKTRKRFPTLNLANGAILRKNSYVDIRNVYKIDWTLLKRYTNADTLDAHKYRFERESCVRLLAKCKTLVDYEPEEQLHTPIPGPSGPTSEDEHESGNLLVSRPSSVASEARSLPPDAEQSDFCEAPFDIERIVCPRPKVPPDHQEKPIMAAFLNETLVHPLEHILEAIQYRSYGTGQKPMVRSPKPLEVRESLDRFYRDFKGATAVFIASTM